MAVVLAVLVDGCKGGAGRDHGCDGGVFEEGDGEGGCEGGCEGGRKGGGRGVRKVVGSVQVSKAPLRK